MSALSARIRRAADELEVDGVATGRAILERVVPTVSAREREAFFLYGLMAAIQVELAKPRRRHRGPDEPKSDEEPS